MRGPSGPLSGVPGPSGPLSGVPGPSGAPSTVGWGLLLASDSGGLGLAQATIGGQLATVARDPAGLPVDAARAHPAHGTSQNVNGHRDLLSQPLPVYVPYGQGDTAGRGCGAPRPPGDEERPLSTEKVDHDVIVVGGGPAGLAAATWLGRYRRSVLVLDWGPPRSWATEVTHGYLGSDAVSPAELLDQARTDLAAYPTTSRRESRAIRAKAQAGGGFVGTTDDGAVRSSGYMGRRSRSVLTPP